MRREPELGVIGGSGFYALNPAEQSRPHLIETPFAEAPVTLYRESLADRAIWFLPRHGKDHAVPPHRINYRANLYALRQAGVNTIIAVNAVGGIHPDADPGSLVIPDQVIDYTWGREHTYFDGPDALENHVDFTYPYHPGLSRRLIETCGKLQLPVKWGGVYGCTQGPRLETAAEITRLRHDGCDIVGMTGMPEAALARELALDYACLALVVNWAAGISEREITLEQIRAELEQGVKRIRELLAELLVTPDSRAVPD